MGNWTKWTVISAVSLMLSSCAGTFPFWTETPRPPQLIQADYAEISGWTEDQQQQAFTAFQKSCNRILKASPDKPFGLGLTYGDWQSSCAALKNIAPSSTDSVPARTYFEANFTPYLVESNGSPEGLFTGYYEASLRGSLTRTGPYQTPLRLRPADLVMVNLGEFRKEFKGQRIAGRVTDGYLKPYEDRAAIDAGKLPKAVDQALVWVDSPVDAFFLQVQGSGVVTLPDGTAFRVGFDGQNGHPYQAIGKVLIERGALTKENVSMQSIRDWLAKNPDQTQEILESNPSYIFFKKLETDGPVGGEGVVLTAGRSLAVDRSIWPYGVPMFISAEHPEGDTDGENRRIEQLLIAQDTGGAIIGAVRGDFFWGYGDQAAHKAGLMKSKGQLWVLLPKGKRPAFE